LLTISLSIAFGLLFALSFIHLFVMKIILHRQEKFAPRHVGNARMNAKMTSHSILSIEGSSEIALGCRFVILSKHGYALLAMKYIQDVRRRAMFVMGGYHHNSF
jgi:hypothetical protein